MRRNDSLPLNACRALHHHNIAMGRPLRGPFDLLGRAALITRLRRLFRGEPSLQLDASVLGDSEAYVLAQLDRLRSRFGLELPLTANSGAPLGALDLNGLATLEQLPATARLTLAEFCAVPGEPTVAAMLQRLDNPWDGAFLVEESQRYLRRQWHHLRRGV